MTETHTPPEMSDAPDERANAATPSRRHGPETSLPLVSVVVVNYNYGRYLRDAVESVFGQTYAEVECIVVDNASTDETPQVLEGLQAAHPGLIVIPRASNDGQTPASLDGLTASSGQYVIFLDADDYLLPRCVETHIYAHLSLRPHVGFTSGDMMQVAGNQVVVATGEESNRYVRSWKRRRLHLFRPYEGHDSWPSPRVKTDFAGKVHYVPPLTTRWVWSPTSGLCYRRDALRLFADNENLATLRTGTDLYFAFGCGGLSGSAVIDEPVFAYRIHGGNIFTAHAQLDRTLNYTIGGHGDSNIKAQLFLIDHLVRQVKRFTPNILLRAHVILLLLKVDRGEDDDALPRWARRSRAAQAIARHYETFAAAVGAGPARIVLAWCAKSVRSPAALRRSLPPSI